MSIDVHQVVEVEPDWVLEPEALGSKVKFWFKRPQPDSGNAWLFKYPQANTGQHWAEKIVADVATRTGILHAAVELAVFRGDRGSVAESFARGGRELFHGNQILAGKVLNYDPAVRFRQSDHTLANIFLACDKTFIAAEAAKRAKAGLADYLVLDALVGNTDRHHENWGILRKRVGERWEGSLAPSFDHASSLGRELLDTGSARSRQALLDADRVGYYVERGHGGVYWSSEDKKGPSPLGLVRLSSAEYPEIFGPSIQKIKELEQNTFEEIVSKVPVDWMSQIARQFAISLLMYNLQELRKLVP